MKVEVYSKEEKGDAWRLDGVSPGCRCVFIGHSFLTSGIQKRALFDGIWIKWVFGGFILIAYLLIVISLRFSV